MCRIVTIDRGVHDLDELQESTITCTIIHTVHTGGLNYGYKILKSHKLWSVIEVGCYKY